MSDTSTAAIAAATTAAAGATVRHISLDTPIRRGDQVIGLIEIRKPAAGELRGLTMLALSQLDYGALETLLPRITSPVLTKQEVAALDIADFMQLGGEVMDFLLPKAAKPASLN